MDNELTIADEFPSTLMSSRLSAERSILRFEEIHVANEEADDDDEEFAQEYFNKFVQQGVRVQQRKSVINQTSEAAE